jgi:hypothetical protein
MSATGPNQRLKQVAALRGPAADEIGRLASRAAGRESSRAMDIVEYLLFIPLLIYGIALSELLGQWKRVFDVKNFYGPFLVTVVAFTETAIQNIYHHLEIFNKHKDHSYGSYLLGLAGPFFLLLAANSLSKDDDRDGVIDREEFRARLPSTYAFMGAFVALHLLPKFRTDDGKFALRIPIIVLLFGIAVTKKEWPIYVVGLLWLVGLVMRLTENA